MIFTCYCPISAMIYVGVSKDHLCANSSFALEIRFGWCYTKLILEIKHASTSHGRWLGEKVKIFDAVKSFVVVLGYIDRGVTQGNLLCQ